MAGFGNKEMGIGYCGADGQVVSDGGGDGVINGDGAAGIIFQRTDINLIFLDIFCTEIGQLGNTHAGLKKEFDNGGHADVQTDGITQGFVFQRKKNAGGGSDIFGVGQAGSGVGGGKTVLG